MRPIATRFIEVHLFRRRGKRVEFLLIRRAADRTLAGVWQPVTGGIEKREATWRAAAREVLEETGLIPIRWWALEYLSVFYLIARDEVTAVPTFAAEVAWTDTVTLSHEHDLYAFVSPAEAARRVIWATQRHAMRAVREEILDRPSQSAREITDRIAGLRLTRAVPAARRTRPKPASRPAAKPRRR